VAATLICAHRGNSAYFPENTLVALRSACDIGVPMAEIDVHRTADGHIVVMHDATVDRTTNGTGMVADLTLEQIRALDAGSWKSPEFAGEKVPTLAEALELCHKHGMVLCIEVKQEGIAPDVARTIDDCGMVNGVVVISFSFDTVVAMRDLRPAMATGWLTAQIDPSAVDQMIARCLAHGIPVISAYHGVVTPKVVERCRLRGVTLYAWTIDEVAQVRRYAEMGVDVIASNRPAEARQASTA